MHDYKLEGEFLSVNQSTDRGEIDTEEFLNKLSNVTGRSSSAIFEEMEAGAAVDYSVLSLVEQLRDNYKIGLLSNAPSEFLRGLLKEHDLEKYFDVIVISSEVGLIKPSPEIFRHILSMMNIRPDEAIFIDDNIKNVEGAETVGIKSFVYTNAVNLEKDLRTHGAMV